MNDALKKTCDNFLFNQEIIKKTFPFSTTRELRAVCSYYFLSQHNDANEEMLKLCRKILRENNSLFSYFRGNGEIIFTCMLAADSDPGAKMDLALAAYNALKVFFPSNSYLPYLAIIMADLVVPHNYFYVAQIAKSYFDKMNDDHIILTGSEDIPFAGLFAMSNKKEYELLSESEEIFQKLKQSYNVIFSQNALQTAGQALALCSGSTDYKIKNLLELHNLTYSYGMNYSHSFELVALALLANLGIKLNDIAKDLKDVFDYLKDSYGIFSTTKRRQHATMVCAAHYMSANIELTSAVVVAALLEIQQQQAAAAAAS